MSKQFLGRSERKRKSGRNMRIDSWDRLELVIELVRSSLPIDIKIDLTRAEAFEPPPPPLPYDPGESSIMIATPPPCLAEVRVSLLIDETLAWLLPVQFCIDQLLTAEEVVTKLAEAFWLLKGWSQVHALEGRERLQTQRLSTQPVKSPRSPLVH